MTPLDFFLWGYLKSKVYVTRPPTVEVLEQRTIDACREVTPQMLRRVHQSTIDRLQHCIDSQGHTFEHIEYE